MVNTEVSLCGIKMDNPVIAASGTFGYGKEFAELYDINILGSFSFKGTTAQPRFGNPTPRIAECASGMLNSVGLQNPGYKTVIEKILPEMKEYFRKPVMANVGGFSTDEYAEVCEAFGREPQIGWIEHILPQSARRRNELRDRPRIGRTGYEGGAPRYG